jgi:hypothetical protein
MIESMPKYTATSAEEHAVSTAKLGPIRPKTKENRFAEMAGETEEPRNGLH